MSQERRLLKSQTLTLWKVVRENVTHKSRRMGGINVLESVSQVIKFRSNSESAVYKSGPRRERRYIQNKVQIV